MSVKEIFALPSTAIAPRIGAFVFLLIHAGMVASLSWNWIVGDASWLTAVGLPLNVFCMWFQMWQLEWFTQVKLAEATPAPIDSKLFMPYSACPKCGVEELHWLKSTEVTDFPAYFQRVCEFNNVDASWYGSKDVDRLTREWAAKRVENSDVIRECRGCGHTWGQRVGG